MNITPNHIDRWLMLKFSKARTNLMSKSRGQTQSSEEEYLVLTCYYDCIDKENKCLIIWIQDLAKVLLFTKVSRSLKKKDLSLTIATI